MSMDCSECDRLWRVYAFATRQHLECIKAQEQAAIGDDIEKMKELEDVVSAAAEWRDLARAQVKMHEVTHGQPDSRQTIAKKSG